MKANELRLGNLVKYDGKAYAIDSISKEFPTLNTLEFGIGVVDWNNIEPIQLTEEWLVKFGFDKRENTSFIDWHIGINPITHDWLFNITWLENPESIGVPDAPFYRNGFHKLTYVHQLQNLYFTLTNQELTLKQ